MMANSDISLAKVTELIKCPICLDYYNDPRLLPCSHTFCFACITQLAKHNRIGAEDDDDDESDESDNEEHHFVCPLKDGAYIPQYRLHALPVNRVVQNMVELLLSSLPSNEMESKNGGQLPCDLCTKHASKVWCPTCIQQLCDKCIVVHNTEFAHTLMSVAERISFACSQHTNETVTFWCTKCKLRLCPLCLSSDDRHEQHRNAIEPLSESIEEARTKMRTGLEQLNDLQMSLNILSEHVAAIIHEQNENHATTRATVDKQFLWLTELIRERQEAVNKELEDQHVIVRSRLQQVELRIRQQVNHVRSLTTSSRRVLETDSAMPLLETCDSLKKICAEASRNHENLARCCIAEEAKATNPTADKAAIKELIANFIKVTFNDVQNQASLICKELIISQPTDRAQRFYTGVFSLGYRFRLTRAIRLASVTIKSTYTGSISAILYDYNGHEQHQSSRVSPDNTFKWTSIPMHNTLVTSCYSLLICCDDTQGSIGYQQDTSNFRQLDAHCAVASVYAMKKNNQTRRQFEFSLGDRAINMRLIYHVD